MIPVAVLALLSDAAPGQAHPVPAPVPRLPEAGQLFVSPGLTVGGSTTLSSGTGLVLGGEVSAGRMNPKSINFYLSYLGLVADGLYDWHRGGGRLMLGPMVGLFVFGGLDGGLLVDLSSGQARYGGAIRAYASVGYLAVYLRYGALGGAPDFVEFGLLLKLPLWRRSAGP